MMKKSILITLLAFGLVTGFLTSTVFAAEQTDQPKSEERAEKGWQDALEAQSALLKAWLAAEKEATYDQAQAYLDEAKAWYARAKEEAGEEVSRKIAAYLSKKKVFGFILDNNGTLYASKIINRLIA